MGTMDASFEFEGYNSRDTVAFPHTPTSIPVILTTDGQFVSAHAPGLNRAFHLTPKGWQDLAFAAERLKARAIAAWLDMGAIPDSWVRPQ